MIGIGCVRGKVIGAGISYHMRNDMDNRIGFQICKTGNFAKQRGVQHSYFPFCLLMAQKRGIIIGNDGGLNKRNA